MKRIMVAIDGSIHAKDAFNMAVNLLNKDNGVLLLLHCVPTVQSSILDPLHDKLDHVENVENIEKAKAIRTEYETLCNEQNITFEYEEIKTSNPGPTIAEKADRSNIELLCLGRRGLGAIKTLLMGSVSEHVMRNVKCPLLVCTHKNIV
eukprot:TRINITY_DN5898_c0_g1_i1.p1 TRINITY_DN5898_c0_g1~~TRINITY_DN5898_c0_g1_i1.p1  ORF type:complete len:149 (-),score=17.33 TRINITY_DN5898_c0_g1_i1:78-524(-)